MEIKKDRIYKWNINKIEIKFNVNKAEKINQKKVTDENRRKIYNLQIFIILLNSLIVILKFMNVNFDFLFNLIN